MAGIIGLEVIPKLLNLRFQ